MSDALLSRSELPSEADRHRPPAVAEIRRLLPGLDVLSLLGSGGMSAVYLAMQTMLDRPVAIKLLSPVLSQLPGYTQRFTQEARAMARLRHPGIAAVYDVGQTAEGRLYLVMEFIEGTNLAEVIARRKLTVEEALALAVEVCEALAFAHRHGVIHRDVKPANIMLEKGGRARLIDFGLARLHESITDRGMTIVGTVVGTPGYMAPEQERGEPADHRADLYSTGAMLYEVLCGSLPQGLGLPPSRLSGCTRRVDQVIFKALQADPANRYQTALEMQRALQRAARRWGDRLPAALLVGALLVLAGAGAWWHHSRRLSTVLAPPPAADSSPKVAAAPPAAAAPFVNSLGMRFLPVPIEGGPTAGQRILFSVWETRVRDFEWYVNAAGMTLNPCPYYRKPTAPMESVSWPEANAFAQWLTVTERKLGQITAHQVYRLPTDHEWSCAVGIGRLEDPALPPVNKAGRHRELFPWGKTWPPPAGSGNYASTELDLPNYTHPILEGYSDGFRYMAPVGSYAPNAFGLYDLGGNVAEWCQDLFDVGGPEMRVVRGGCFHSYKDTQICSSARSGLQPGTRHWETGFRVVLAPVNGP